MEEIKYRFDKRTTDSKLFEEVIDYRLEVPCVNRADILDYVYRLYRYGEHLYITDIFPFMFADDSRCFQRFTSREGFSVNMKQLAVTCLQIFVDELIGSNPDAIMVVSGSYESGEPTDKPSRKLRLYWYFFQPLLDKLHLDVVDMSDKNAFLLLDKSSGLNREDIRNSYIQFKQSQHHA